MLFIEKVKKSCKPLTLRKNNTLYGAPNAILKQCFGNSKHSLYVENKCLWPMKKSHCSKRKSTCLSDAYFKTLYFSLLMVSCLMLAIISKCF